MKRGRQSDGLGPIELLEEAFHLLRGAPAGVLAPYALGTLPFILALLYFWADMSRGAFAREHAAPATLGVTLAFVWMKCWQAVFASGLRARLIQQESAPWTAKRVGNLAITQTALQPFGLFVVPAAMLIVLPSGWAYSFFQNVTVLGDGSLGISETSKISAAQASSRPGQNYAALGILAIFAFFVWVNVALFMAWLPGLLKTFLGIDTAFTRAGIFSILNTTYLACSVAIAYCCIDPLAKAIYVLRCFYGQSLTTGEDLKAALSRARAIAALSILCCLAGAGSVSAAPAEPAVSPSQLIQSIDQVLKEPQFAWRMPRAQPDESNAAQRSWLVRVLRGAATAVLDGFKWVGRSLWQTARWIVEAISKLWPKSSYSQSSGSGFAWASFLQILLLALIVGIAAILAVLIIRAVKRRRVRPIVMANAVAAKPDLRDENVVADQLPEDGWLTLARELMAQGEFRLALRAFYLAGLAHLAGRELLSIALFKSNREYETELKRRGRAYPETLDAFSQNVAAFDRVWYGPHAVTDEALQQFQANLDRIRAC